MRKPYFRIYAKTKMQISCAVTTRLISAFVFAKLIVQSIYFLNVKPFSNLFGCTYWFVLDQVRNPKYKCSRGTAYILCIMNQAKHCFKCAKKVADQLYCNGASDQHLGVRYIDSTTPLLPKFQTSANVPSLSQTCS